jgi:hypothetical protein
MDNNEINYQPNFTLSKFKRRRDLLPWWVIASIWMFLVFSAAVPVAIVFGLLRYNFNISILGLETNDPFSITGLFLMLLFTLKGITAFGLWTEKKWAVGLGKIDAAISIAVCCLVMAAPFVGLGHIFTIRLELIIVIPYFYKMNSIQFDWLYFDDQTGINAESSGTSSETQRV